MRVVVSSGLQKMNPLYNVKHIQVASNATLSAVQNVEIPFALGSLFFGDGRAGRCDDEKM